MSDLESLASYRSTDVMAANQQENSDNKFAEDCCDKTLTHLQNLVEAQKMEINELKEMISRKDVAMSTQKTKMGSQKKEIRRLRIHLTDLTGQLAASKQPTGSYKQEPSYDYNASIAATFKNLANNCYKPKEGNGKSEGNGSESPNPLSYTDDVGNAALGIANLKKKAKPASTGTSISYMDRWRERYQELINYKLQHGHCNVPLTHNAGLHRWVRSQRVHRQQFDKDLPCDSMCQERIDALDRIGFCWFVGHQPKDQQWEEMFQELIDYKSIHGDCNVKSSSGKLGKWVLNQRARRRLMEKVGEGKCRGMTWARVAKLDAIDFTWDGKQISR